MFSIQVLVVGVYVAGVIVVLFVTKVTVARLKRTTVNDFKKPFDFQFLLLDVCSKSNLIINGKVV